MTFKLCIIIYSNIIWVVKCWCIVRYMCVFYNTIQLTSNSFSNLRNFYRMIFKYIIISISELFMNYCASGYEIKNVFCNSKSKNLCNYNDTKVVLCIIFL